MKVALDSLKEPHPKAFEAWAVSFCEAQPATTELEMLLRGMGFTVEVVHAC